MNEYNIFYQLFLLLFCSYVFIHEKAYQTKDTGMVSSVMTKVKGFGRNYGRIMDVADYVFPPEGANVFCIMTRLYVTENQFQGRCPDVRKSIKTGLSLGNPCRLLADLCFNTNFMFFRGNIPSTMTPEKIKNCTYHPEENPFCPIFRVEDILNYTGQTVEKLIEKGGEIGINIEWKCNLDIDLDYCVPLYSFTRLDKPFEKNAVSKGYNFRFARYYKSDNGTEYRTLYKVFAIRFDVMVTGNAGKFDMVPTLINVVAALTCLGLGTVFCDIILLNFLKGAKQYKARKFEEVRIYSLV
uniref:Uncharacterized protein n=1 Tax=Periophthalmus magnuspinnatus TaxID=409849 RepID=A0A3B4AEI4_9GOBI